VPAFGLVSRLQDRRPGIQRAIGAIAITVGAAAIALTGVSSADAATPTAPPPVTILTSNPFVSLGGDFFITPTGDTATYANGPEILDSHGNVVWFHAVPEGLTSSDFREQFYNGQPVLTWWQGTGFGGLSKGNARSASG
jgi:hypothetical protein